MDPCPLITLSDLPSECLIKIFRFLPPCDVASVGQLNQRFFSLSCDKDVVEVADFSSVNCSAKFDAYFRERARTQNITTLNLKNCFWVAPSYIVKAVLKCKNLKSLNILRCGLMNKYIIHILSVLPSIKILAWSLEHETISPSSYLDEYLTVLQADLNQTSLDNLSSMYVEMWSSSIDFLILEKYLSRCLNLEELCLNFSELQKKPSNNLLLEQYLQQCHLKKLDTFLITCDNSINISVFHPNDFSNGITLFAERLLNGRNRNIPWKKLWLGMFLVSSINGMPSFSSEECKSVFCATHISLHYQAFGVETKSLLFDHAKALTHLELVGFKFTPQDMDNIIRLGDTLQCLNFVECSFEYSDYMLEAPLKESCKQCFNLVELNLLGSHFVFENKLWDCLNALKGLRKLALPVCAINGILVKSNCTEAASKRQCRGLSDIELSSSPFYKLTCECNLEVIDIRGCTTYNILGSNCIGSTSSFTNQHLIALSNLKGLKSLTLTDLPGVQQGRFLQMIASNCKLLHILRVSHLGLPGYFAFASLLIQASPSFTYLQYLKLEHPYINLSSRQFWESVCSMSTLKQICIITKLHCDLELPFVVGQLCRLKNLEVFHIHANILKYLKFESLLIKELGRRISIIVELYKNFHNRAKGYGQKRNSDHFKNLCLTLCDIAMLN